MSSAARCTSSSATTTSRAPARSSRPESRSEEAPVSSLDAARELHARGRSENSAGHYGRAEAALKRALAALERSDDPGLDTVELQRLRARIHITRAVSRFGIAGPEAGLAVLDQVHRMLEGQTTPLLGAQAHLQAGAINVMASNWGRALAELEHVEPHLDDLVPTERCAALINRGLAHVSLLHLDLGRKDLEAALDLAVTHDLPVEEFKARHNLGCLAYMAGDIPAALRLIGEAADLDVGITTARGELDHAKVLLDAGLVDEAERVLQRGLEAARRDHQPVERGEIQLDLARAALLLGDVSTARVRAGQALRTFRALHADGRTEEVELFGAAVDLGAGRHLTRAARVAARWSSPRPVTPPERLATRVRVEVALARNDLDTARAELDRLVTDQPQPLGARQHEHLLASRLASAEGDGPRATAILREAAEELAREQGGVHSMEIRAGLAFHAARIRDADVAAATDSGSLPELFESVERWRAASHRAPPLRPPDDEETAELVGRLRQLQRGAHDGSPLSATQQQVTVLQSQITERLRTLQGSRSESDVRAVDVEQTMQAAQERRATLVTFHEIRGTLVRLSLGGETVRQSTLGPVRDIASATARLNADVRAAAFARPSMAAFLGRARDSSLREVDTLLLRGLELEDAVVIVPTVGLAALPWRALPSLREHPVVAAPSATAWVRRSATSTSEPAVAALAGPGLPRAREEVRSVAKAWGRHTESTSGTTNRYAVSADVRSALATANVVHLAAHGHHVDQSPLFSSVDLADGPVFAHELRAPLAAELVILSACDVGRSRGRPGDEPLGLAAALLGLGVQCVVAATNPVHDDVAAAVMVDLHGRLVAGVDVATALRDTAAEVAGAEAFCAYGSTWARTTFAQ